MKLSAISRASIRAWLKAKGHRAAKVDKLKLDDRVADIYALHGMDRRAQ